MKELMVAFTALVLVLTSECNSAQAGSEGAKSGGQSAAVKQSSSASQTSTSGVSSRKYRNTGTQTPPYKYYNQSAY